MVDWDCFGIIVVSFVFVSIDIIKVSIVIYILCKI